jgi:hypothetical protein
LRQWWWHIRISFQGLIRLRKQVGDLRSVDKLNLSPVLNLAVQGCSLLLEFGELLAAFQILFSSTSRQRRYLKYVQSIFKLIISDANVLAVLQLEATHQKCR